MHEVALAESVLKIVEDVAACNAATRVHTVWLELGALSHVEADALAFCFDAVTRGTIADGAKLEIATSPGAAWCMCCSDRVPLAQLGEACPACGGYQLEVVAGDAMRVKEIGIT